MTDVHPDLDAGEPRPWERPGAVRRDCAPHRGNLLAVLSKASLALGVLSALFGVPLVVGLPVSLVTVVLAGRDLARMAAGTVDPGGREATELARRWGEYGVFLSAFAPLTAPFVWWFLVLAIMLLSWLTQAF